MFIVHILEVRGDVRSPCLAGICGCISDIIAPVTLLLSATERIMSLLAVKRKPGKFVLLDSAEVNNGLGLCVLCTGNADEPATWELRLNKTPLLFVGVLVVIRPEQDVAGVTTAVGEDIFKYDAPCEACGT